MPESASSKKARKQDYKQRVNQIKENNPCTDCGEFHPYYVMQFDHLRNNKTANVSAMIRNRRGIDVIMKEIQKCELVCANCHAKRTYRRAARKRKKK